MALYEQPNLTSGIDEAIISTASAVPMLPIMLLIFVFGMVFIGGSSNQKKRNGYADYPFWAVLGSVAITFLSLIFTLKKGIIDGTTLGIVIAFTILCGVWFFISKGRGET